jgi:hypothetical protein
MCVSITLIAGLEMDWISMVPFSRKGWGGVNVVVVD